MPLWHRRCNCSVRTAPHARAALPLRPCCVLRAVLRLEADLDTLHSAALWADVPALEDAVAATAAALEEEPRRTAELRGRCERLAGALRAVEEEEAAAVSEGGTDVGREGGRGRGGEGRGLPLWCCTHGCLELPYSKLSLHIFILYGAGPGLLLAVARRQQLLALMLHTLRCARALTRALLTP